MEFKGKITAFPSSDIKINCLNEEEYRAITKMLNEEIKLGNKIKWHTFADKNSHPFRVMARGLDPATDSNAIVDDLKTNGFKILSAVNIFKTEYKKDSNNEKKIIKSQIKLLLLRLFMFTFGNSELIDKIYNIITIIS